MRLLGHFCAVSLLISICLGQASTASGQGYTDNILDLQNMSFAPDRALLDSTLEYVKVIKLPGKNVTPLGALIRVYDAGVT